MADITVEEERKRRLDLWADLEARDLVARARPEDLRQRHIYGGAQGIWVDKDRTGQIAGNDGGITVGILHTGRHYPDDLSEDGVIYHCSPCSWTETLRIRRQLVRNRSRHALVHG